MAQLGLSLIGIATLSLSVLAQAPAFEVVSIKRDVGVDSGGHNDLQGNAYVGHGVTVAGLLALAYDPLPASQIVGGPAWIHAERFDIKATFLGNPTRMQINEMLRRLLADRFRLQAHVESRLTRVLQLVMAKSGALGPSLRRSVLDCSLAGVLAAAASTPNSCMFHYNSGHIEGRGITLDQLAAKLIAERVVINRTGLTGAFDVDFAWTPPTSTAPDDSAPPSLTTALQEQLGLKLEAATGTADVLLIDRVEHPTED